jgi:hypothetical protein
VNDKGSTLQVEITLASVKTITMGLEFDLTPTQLINFRKYSGKDVKEYAGSFRLLNASDGAGTVVIHANAKTGAHHHGDLESVIYVVTGKARMRWGDNLEFTKYTEAFEENPNSRARAQKQCARRI